MQLNNAGEMIRKWWLELGNKFANIVLDEYVIMPNHFHGIIQMNDTSVGADLRVCPDIHYQGNHIGLPLQNDSNSSIPTIIQWFKTMTTNEYIQGVKTNIFPSFEKRVWQRNYYEHIIRDEDELNHIREYIINNPKNWSEDSLFFE